MSAFDADLFQPLLHTGFGRRHIRSQQREAVQHRCLGYRILDVVIAAAGSVTVVRAERDDRFSRKVVCGKERMNGLRNGRRPDGVTDKDSLILFHIINSGFRRAVSISLFRMVLITHVVKLYRVRAAGFNQMNITAYGRPYVFGHDLRSTFSVAFPMMIFAPVEASTSAG